MSGISDRVAALESLLKSQTPSLLVSATIPGLHLKSSANLREHWAVKSKRNTSQKNIVAAQMNVLVHGLRPIVRVTLTRVGPRQMDSDNLASAFKAVRDEIARVLRIDDGSPLIEWAYRQERGEYAIKIDMEAR